MERFGEELLVTVTLYMEGGVLPHQNVRRRSLDNTTRLRQSISKLLEDALKATGMPYRIVVLMRSGYKKAVKDFKKGLEDGEQDLLLIDLDQPKEKDLQKARAQRLLELEIELKWQERVFFMVREMEAWFLSQLEGIEQLAAAQNWIRMKEDQPLSEDKSIAGKVITQVSKPSELLGTLISRYFLTQRQPKKKKAKYGKLKHSHLLMAQLDLQQLRKDFEDVDRLLNYLQPS